MKLHLPKLLLAALLALPLSAVEWTTDTTGDQTVTENVNVSGTATVGNITFDGGAGSTITVSGEGSIGGSGNLTVSSGTVVFDGVSRPASTGNITVSTEATLEIKNNAQVLNTNDWNGSSAVNVYGTLKVEDLRYEYGNFGYLRDNANAIKMYDGSRLEITASGTATRGIQFVGSGALYTIALAAGTEDNQRKLTWTSSDVGAFAADNLAGSGLFIEVGEYAQLDLQKNIGTGLKIIKRGDGELILNGTVHLDQWRGIEIDAGTMTLGDSANITSAGDWFNVYENGTLNMNGKAGGNHLTLNADGDVTNAQNNEMTINLYRWVDDDGNEETDPVLKTGKLSISADATAGRNGKIIMAEGSEVDLGGHLFYNSIDISDGGTLKNAYKMSGTLSSSGAIEMKLDGNDLIATAASDSTLAKGRFYSDESVSITGTDNENISITGYTSTYGAVSAQYGDINITGVGGVTLSDNHATVDTDEAYFTAGALAAAGSVTLESAGSVVISDNSAEGNSQAAGAIYAGAGVSISGADILIEGNTYEDGNGGAVRGDGDAVVLTGTDGSVTIRSNTAGEAGGAVYASTGVEISSAADIVIENNTAGDAGGAIYSGDDVTLTPGEGGKVTISGNTAGGSGGAIYSSGTVTISGGTYEIKDNMADGYGGAIYAETGVDISADAGNVTFSGNTHDGGTANDVELWDGEANLSATNGHTLEMQGGITGAAELNISTDEASSVKLGGTSSTANLTIQNGRVFGITSDSGEQAVINISESVTLSNAYMQDVALVDEYIEAALTSENSTYIFNNAPTEAVGTYSGDALTYTTTAPLLNGFTTIDGLLSVGVTYDFLKAFMSADGTPVNVILTLTSDDTGLGDDVFTFTLDENTIALLEASQLESYGFYDADGNLIGENEAVLASANGVTFAMNGITKLVPEPTSTTLSLLALAALAARRRRRA